MGNRPEGYDFQMRALKLDSTIFVFVLCLHICYWICVIPFVVSSTLVKFGAQETHYLLLYFLYLVYDVAFGTRVHIYISHSKF